jgi:hypothetical protein
LFCAGLPTESALKSGVRTQPGVDLTKAVSAGKYGNESIVEFIDRLMLDSLLLDEAVLRNGLKQFQRLDLRAEGAKRGTWREVLRSVLVIVVLPPVTFIDSDEVLTCQSLSAIPSHYFGRNLGRC